MEQQQLEPESRMSMRSLVMYITNLTDGSLLVTYTVTPYAGVGCAGTDFTIIITVDPEPVVASTQFDVTVCSDEVIGVSLPATDDSGLSLTSYDISAVVDGDLSGTATTGTGITDVNAISNDVYTNLTDGSLLVTYTVTPYVGTCAGTDFTIIITVDPEPVVASAQFDATVCSDEVIGVELTSNR